MNDAETQRASPTACVITWLAVIAAAMVLGAVLAVMIMVTL